MNPVFAVVRRHPLVSFFVLAFTLSWGLGAILNGHPLLAPDGSFVTGVLIAALTVVAIADGRPGLNDLAHRIVRWRVSPRWYLVVFALPVVIVATVVALLPIFGGAPLDWSKQPALASTVLLFAVLVVLPIGAPVSEEIGWRGVALPRLLIGRSALTASLVLGAVWSLWHLPVVISDPELRVPVPFLLQVIPVSVLFTWIFVHTRASVFVAILFHAWLDVALAYAGAMVAPRDYPLLWWLLLATESVAAVIVVAIWGTALVRGPAVDAGSRPAPAAAS